MDRAERRSDDCGDEKIRVEKCIEVIDERVKDRQIDRQTILRNG